MNCNCISDLEKRLADHFRPKAGPNVTATCTATGFVLSENRMTLAHNTEFCIKGSGKGFTSAKGKLVPVVASYCPFCARDTRRYTVGADAGLDAAFGFGTAGTPDAEGAR
jgi:hypothetical protein